MTQYEVTFVAVVTADDEDDAIDQADQHVRDGVAAITILEVNEP